MNKLLLLPSAKFIPPELQLEFGRIPTGLVPVDSRPVLEHIAGPYIKEGFEALIAVNEGADLVEKFLSKRPDLHTSSYNVGQTKSLGETIFLSIKSCTILPGFLVINFADTHIDEPLTIPDAIAYSKLAEHFRWTTFAVDSEKRIVRIEEKDVEKSDDTDWKTFVGVFSISNVRLFTDILEKCLSRPRERLDPFYIALTEYFNGLSTASRNLYSAVSWHDFGHLDTYYSSKKTFFLNRRYFNTIKIDRFKGVLRKTSTETRKFLDEILWYLKLPKGLQHIAPRVFDFSLEFERPFVELEFYGYPALNDVFLYGNFHIGLWNQILIAIKSLISELFKYQYNPTDDNVLSASMKDMYEEKTRSRLQKINDNPLFEVFYQKNLKINGKDCLNLPETLSMMGTIAEKIKLYEKRCFSIIHGDLCLSNILFDQRNNIVRVIDPRGRFGNLELYGDMRYDIAKLVHSFEGDYDFIVNGLFEIRTDMNEIFLNVFLNENHLRVRELFSNWLRKNWNDDLLGIQYIESMLFLSMVPLHADSPDSQKAFMAKGLTIFTDLVSKINSSETKTTKEKT
ncbi:MAG: hypothetical protein HQM10_13340 [Candidatus Riflebacteria bacterium]|nr:hypothetical protein [Candidatus Riflebacteria bacterium]